MQEALDHQLAHILDALQPVGTNSRTEPHSLLACPSVPSQLPGVDKDRSDAPLLLDRRRHLSFITPSAPATPPIPVPASLIESLPAASSLLSTVSDTARRGFSDEAGVAVKVLGRDVGSSSGFKSQIPARSAAAGSAQHPPIGTANGVGCEESGGGRGDSGAGTATTFAAAALGLKSQLLSRLRESIPAWSLSARTGHGEGSHEGESGGSIVGV